MTNNKNMFLSSILRRFVNWQAKLKRISPRPSALKISLLIFDNKYICITYKINTLKQMNKKDSANKLGIAIKINKKAPMPVLAAGLEPFATRGCKT
ncbi:hypothetical protein WN093_12810 [Gammaproteobacteria bacterium AS21]